MGASTASAGTGAVASGAADDEDDEDDDVGDVDGAEVSVAVESGAAACIDTDVGSDVPVVAAVDDGVDATVPSPAVAVLLDDGSALAAVQSLGDDDVNVGSGTTPEATAGGTNAEPSTGTVLALPVRAVIGTAVTTIDGGPAPTGDVTTPAEPETMRGGDATVLALGGDAVIVLPGDSVVTVTGLNAVLDASVASSSSWSRCGNIWPFDMDFLAFTTASYSRWKLSSSSEKPTYSMCFVSIIA